MTNLTTLSGDIGAAGNSDNSYHVVTGSGVDGTAILDGFTITLGNANASYPYDRGGGIYNYINSSPALANVTFSGNTAVYGGGMYNYSNSNPELTNVTFSGNTASFGGGGMFNDTNSSPQLTGVTFSGNMASQNGGGMLNNSSPILVNVTFSGNTASFGGGMYNYNNSIPALANVTFSGNTATNYGGGMFNVSSRPARANVTRRSARDQPGQARPPRVGGAGDGLLQRRPAGGGDRVQRPALLVIGFTVGVCGGFFGIGGAWIVTPALNIIGFPMPYAIGRPGTHGGQIDRLHPAPRQIRQRRHQARGLR